MNLIDVKKIKIHNRFDILFKYMYIIYKENNHECSFYENAYKRHLEIWNNFLEYDDPTKNSYNKFVSRFDNIIEQIKKDGFNLEFEGVPIYNLNLLNGAHRATACLFYNKPLKYYEDEKAKDGQLDCSYYFFNKLSRNNEKIENYFFDQAAITCCDIFEDSKIICIFPSAVKSGGINELRTALNNFGIIYEKHIQLNDLGSINLMKELYKDEIWAESNDGDGYKQKARLCFDSSEKYPMIVFLVRMSREQSIVVKEKIRKIYNIGKHSVHINDTQEESKRISRALFNENSVHYLNYAKPTKIFTEMLKYFEKTININDKICVTASMVLAGYGLREAKDIDYLHIEKNKFIENEFISSHNKYIESFYPDFLENIILDPRNYFYHRGIKFISLKNLEKMKRKRKEDKDIEDLKMIGKINEL